MSSRLKTLTRPPCMPMRAPTADPLPASSIQKLDRMLVQLGSLKLDKIPGRLEPSLTSSKRRAECRADNCFHALHDAAYIRPSQLAYTRAPVCHALVALRYGVDCYAVAERRARLGSLHGVHVGCIATDGESANSPRSLASDCLNLLNRDPRRRLGQTGRVPHLVVVPGRD
jgi:hypothetical protein